MAGTAVTKSVVAAEPGGKKREEIFVDIIERISVTFSSSVSTGLCHALSLLTFFSSTSQDILPFFSFSFVEILYICPEFVVLNVLDSDGIHCPFMCLPVFSSLLGFISSLPQLAWDKRLCCCCCCCCC
jgi:hypothetical protein